MGRLVAILTVLLIAASVAPADITPEQPFGGARGPEPVEGQARIDALIKQLGDADGTVRKEASRQLEEIGPDAVPALEEAMKSDDPEVRMRAKEIHRKLTNPTPEELDALRAAIQKAFDAGDYDAVIAPARLLLFAEGSSTADRLWLGHACQLLGRWEEAVNAYLDVLKRMDAELKDGPKPVPAPRPFLHGNFDGPGPHAIRGGVRAPVRVRDPNWRSNLIKQRTSLALWVARMQGAELKDAKAAVRTLQQALVQAEPGRSRVSYIYLQLLRELAVMQEQADDARAALATWQKVHLQALEGDNPQPLPNLVDIYAVDRALVHLKGGDALPELTFLYPLTPDAPEAHLAPDEDETRARSYHPRGKQTCPHWNFAFAPPPGKEFATLTFACDIEQIKPRHGGHFRCFVLTPEVDISGLTLGGIGWPKDPETGRDVIRRTFDIPAGVRLVCIQTGSWKDCFTMHGIDVRATFRPAGKREPLGERVGAWMQTEFLPEGGKASRGEEEINNGSAYSDVEPGTYRLRYEVPGRDDVFDQQIVIEPGKRYGIFVNLDSPFKWSQAGPAGMGRFPDSGLGLAPLPGGGYLAAWGNEHERIMLCTTKDLVTWSEPTPAPFNSVFRNVAPAIHAGKDGTVWLAYFSTRLALLDSTVPKFDLWLTSTRDGMTWTPPRRVALKEPVGTPSHPPKMLEGPDGRCLILWRARGAAAASLGDIRELDPIKSPTAANGMQPTDYTVAVDPDGLFHMVFAMPNRGIGHATSKDGVNWSHGTEIVKPVSGYPLDHPQLILVGGKALLLYDYRGGRMCPLPAKGKPIDVDAGMKIVSHVVPLNGSRPLITKDGEVLLLAGFNTSWLLRAKAEDVAAAFDEHGKE